MLAVHQTFLENELLSLLQSVLFTVAGATVAEATAAMQLADYLPIVAAM